jgi:hypothetical protein
MSKITEEDYYSKGYVDLIRDNDFSKFKTFREYQECAKIHNDIIRAHNSFVSDCSPNAYNDGFAYLGDGVSISFSNDYITREHIKAAQAYFGELRKKQKEIK